MISKELLASLVALIVLETALSYLSVFKTANNLF